MYLGTAASALSFVHCHHQNTAVVRRPTELDWPSVTQMLKVDGFVCWVKNMCAPYPFACVALRPSGVRIVADLRVACDVVLKSEEHSTAHSEHAPLVLDKVPGGSNLLDWEQVEPLRLLPFQTMFRTCCFHLHAPLSSEVRSGRRSGCLHLPHSLLVDLILLRPLRFYPQPVFARLRFSAS